MTNGQTGLLGVGVTLVASGNALLPNQSSRGWLYAGVGITVLGVAIMAGVAVSVLIQRHATHPSGLDKRRRAMTRDVLARYLEDSQQLLDGDRDSQSLVREAFTWTRSVYTYLKETMGITYAVRFRGGTQEPEAIITASGARGLPVDAAKIIHRCRANLIEIIKELS